MDNTSAERQRRYIQRLKKRAAEPHGPDLVLDALAKLQPQHFPRGAEAAFAHRVMAEAERLLAVTNGAPGRHDAPPAKSQKEIAALRAEIERLRKQLAEARKSEPEQVVALRQRIGTLQQRQARREIAAKRKPKPLGPDTELGRAKTEIKNLKAKVTRLTTHYGHTFETESLIAKALHPEATPSDEIRQEAYKAFTAWKSDSKSVARKREASS